MELHCQLRTAWWLLVVVLLVPTWTPVEARGRGWWSGGGGLWDTGGRGSSSTQSKDRDQQDTQSGSESKPADYHQPPPYSPNYTRHSLPYPGSSSAGGGYYDHQSDYPSSGPYLDVQYPGGGPPPGYKSSYSVMPGLFDSHGRRGRLHVSSYRSTLFGYSKNFFRPSFPTIIFLPLTHYHYPSSIPPSTSWGCDCYVDNRTAVCLYKLKDALIPYCVESPVTAVFIQSEEVDWLSSDAFRHLPHLEYINITDTMLRSLPRKLFHYNRDLKHLLVQKNPDLRSLDSMVFSGASNLEDVILDRNDIDSLERDVFTHVKNVKRLNLAYNKIRSLPEGIFRNNQELQELVLSGNPLHISSDTAWEVLTNNAKLRVLLMRNCKLEDLPNGLLRNAAKLEWLDLSRNKISRFPSKFTRDCRSLAYLGLAYNKLEVLASDVLQQHGGSLATLDLEGNPLRCGCDILPLASWTALRKDAVARLPKCSGPKYSQKQSLRHWFHSEAATECASRTSSLRSDLNRVLSVARAVAEKPPSFFANLLSVSDGEVSFTATNYFLHATAARTNADVDTVVWHWARLLEKVLDRRHLRYAEMAGRSGIIQTVWDRSELLLTKLDKENPLNFHFDFNVDPLATTTTKPPAARRDDYQPRPKGFEPLVNFTYVTNDVPENLTKAVDDGIEEELKMLFGVINGTNADSLNTNAGVKKLNVTEQLVAGLRSELREVLATLLLSIDRAKWDAAEQVFIEQQEKKPGKSLQQSPQPLRPMVLTSSGTVMSGAGSCMLMQPRLTVLVAFLTLLAHTLV